MKDQAEDKFSASPVLVKSYEANPESHYSVSESPSSLQSPSSSSSNASPRSTQSSNKGDSRKSSGIVYRIKDHVKMGPTFSETVKWKLRLGAKIIQGGGRENIFKQVFGVIEGEELLKASQCYLSTTAGPIAGLLFISTEKVAFCSDRSISFHSPVGESLKTPYKVVIPVRRIKKANQSENVDNPAQKYIEVVTEDNCEFWFMGFLRYEKAFKNLEKAISLGCSLSTNVSSLD